jgi:DNA-binding transcriptional ArsR family regulator
MGATTADPELKAVEIHDVLSNERRQLILKFLRDAGGLLSARELSELIAEAETGESPPPRNIRQSAYVSLHQTHLPKLDELGIVDYDQSAKTVQLNDRAKQVSIYMETVPRYGISWSEYYVAMSFIGLLLVVAAQVGVPFIAGIGSLSLATGVLVIILGSAAYQTYAQGSSIFHRLRE